MMNGNGDIAKEEIAPTPTPEIPDYLTSGSGHLPESPESVSSEV